MKKTTFFLIFTIVALGLTDCKKNSGPGYFMTCKINGITRSFNGNLVAQRQTNDSGKIIQLGMEGFSTSSKTTGVLLQFFVAGQYATDTLALGTYNANGPTIYQMAADDQDLNADIDYSVGYMQSDPFTITFTYVDHTVLKGTFSGTLYWNPVSGNGIMSEAITEGQFYARFQ